MTARGVSHRGEPSEVETRSCRLRRREITAASRLDPSSKGRRRRNDTRLDRPDHHLSQPRDQGQSVARPSPQRTVPSGIVGRRGLRAAVGQGALSADKSELVTQALDRGSCRMLDPDRLGPGVRAIAQDPANEGCRLLPDPSSLVCLLENRHRSERPRQPRPVLRGRARNPEPLFAIVPHAAELQASPGTALSHLREDLADPLFDLLLEARECPDLGVRSSLQVRTRATAETVDLAKGRFGLGQRVAKIVQITQPLPVFAGAGQDTFPRRGVESASEPPRVVLGREGPGVGLRDDCLDERRQR